MYTVIFIVIMLAIIWFSRKIIFNLFKGYLIENIRLGTVFLVFIVGFLIIDGYSKIQMGYAEGLIWLSTGLLCILGIVMLVWLNRKSIKIYLISNSILFTLLLGSIAGYLIVSGYSQIQILHQGKAFHTITANDLIKRGTDKNWLKITEATLSINEAWFANKKAYIPLYTLSNSSYSPNIIVISKNPYTLRMLNTIIRDNLSKEEKITLSSHLKQYENIIVTEINGRKKFWHNVDSKTRNEIKDKNIENVIVIEHNEMLSQEPNNPSRGWTQLSISLLCLFGMIMLFWFTREAYFIFFREFLIANDAVFKILLTLIGGTLIITAYSQAQMVYQEKFPHTITANNLITLGTDKNWLKITEATLSIDEAWYISGSSGIKEAYIPLYASSKSSHSPKVVVISENQAILKILNAIIRDNISREERIILDAKLQLLYEKIMINGIKEPSYRVDSNRVDSKMRDAIKNEMGEDVIFIIHNGMLSYLDAGIRLLIGLFCVLGVIMLFRLEK